MKIENRTQAILDRALEGKAPSKSDCIHLLEQPEISLEAALIRATGNHVARSRYGSEAIILGQVGIEIDACPAACKFCSFGEGHTAFEPSMMSDREIESLAHAFNASGDLYALFFMTMHNFGFEHLLEVVSSIREQMPERPQLVVNIGDFDLVQARELKAAGVDGAYHVRRLREGDDTALDPEARVETIKVIKEAGLDWYYCCEPIGPEHTPEELVEQLWLGLDYGCFQHAAMRRVYMPHSPVAGRGQISELRLAQVVAVIALAVSNHDEVKNIAVHEPNLIGLTAGANVVYAEAGANPRDVEEDTTAHRGRDVAACKKMLYEAGFERLLTQPGMHRDLVEAYKQ